MMVFELIKRNKKNCFDNSFKLEKWVKNLCIKAKKNLFGKLAKLLNIRNKLRKIAKVRKDLMININNLIIIFYYD